MEFLSIFLTKCTEILTDKGKSDTHRKITFDSFLVFYSS